jgi:hypothetical protein
MFVAEQRRSKSSSGVFCYHCMTFSFNGKTVQKVAGTLRVPSAATQIALFFKGCGTWNVPTTFPLFEVVDGIGWRVSNSAVGHLKPLRQ